MATDLPDVAEVVMRGSYQGERFVMVEHFLREAGAYNSTTLGDLLTLLAGASGVNTSILHWFTLIDSGAVIDTLYAKTLDTTTPIELTRTVSLAGGSGGTDTQAWLAICCKLTTDVATRRRRGRMYLPGVNTGMFASGDPDHLDAGFQSNVATKVQEYATAWIANADFAWLVLSRADREAGQATPYSHVVGASCLARVSSQRRRRPVS